RDAAALPLAARQLVGIAVGVLGGQRNALQERAGARPGLVAAARAAEGEKRLADDVADPLPRVERRLRVLEDYLEARAQRPQRLFRQARYVLALEQDAPAGRPVEAQQGAAERGLAGARFADDA